MLGNLELVRGMHSTMLPTCVSASLINLYMYMWQLIFSRKSDCLGCAVLLFALFVCLTLLASFFLPSHLSFKNMYIHYDIYRKFMS